VGGFQHLDAPERRAVAVLHHQAAGVDAVAQHGLQPRAQAGGGLAGAHHDEAAFAGNVQLGAVPASRIGEGAPVESAVRGEETLAMSRAHAGLEDVHERLAPRVGGMGGGHRQPPLTIMTTVRA
jgi:hypothetical protein